MHRLKDTLARTAGRLGLTWARDLTDPIQGLAYDEGVREGRHGSRGSTPAPGEPETTVSGFGSGAVTVLKWTGLGTVGGAFFLMALVAAASIGLLVGILYLLGLLLNVQAG